MSHLLIFQQKQNINNKAKKICLVLHAHEK